jgi:hypothetical protein
MRLDMAQGKSYGALRSFSSGNIRTSASNAVGSANDAVLDAIERTAPLPTGKNSGLAAQLTPIDCPCCKQKVPVPTMEIVIDKYRVAPLEARVLEAVWRGRGLEVSQERIFGVMYADDPDGGPATQKMYAALKGAIFNLRERLAGSGYSIESAGYRRGFRLVLGVK